MREYIITDKERQVLHDYIEHGAKGNHFYVIIHRLGKSYETLKNDINLIEQVLDKQSILW